MTAILHLHIPRTAGSSLDAQIRAALSDQLCIAFSSMQRLREIRNESTEIALVSGHFMWGVHELFEDYVYVIVLRDPVERVRSLYDYIRATPGHPKHDFFSTCRWGQILSEPEGEQPLLSNDMVRQLSGIGPRFIPVTRFHFGRAWEILCRPDVIVGFSHDLDTLLAQVSARIGKPISPAGKRNESTQSQLKRLTIERIADLNRWDMELYRRALARFGGAAHHAGCSA